MHHGVGHMPCLFVCVCVHACVRVSVRIVYNTGSAQHMLHNVPCNNHVPCRVHSSDSPAVHKGRSAIAS